MNLPIHGRQPHNLHIYFINTDRSLPFPCSMIGLIALPVVTVQARIATSIVVAPHVVEGPQMVLVHEVG